ncbi:recombinase family protein [Candidatus Saccharibacteria bacterium]|nr:recombinase family protein [Candidatus Saccharibacteria bacterium]
MYPKKSTKRRVAAYARVSTELDAQTRSFESQISYYKKLITKNPSWELVEIFSDEGVSGTNYRRRSGFNKMLTSANSGKIDLILTKSISRFARNTVDALTVTRELKSKNVEVFFEKENISSFDPKSELIFTILSSVAQEESRSISENVRWGIERRMEAGKISAPWKNFLGFSQTKDGVLVVDESEAKIVRRIFAEFLDGASIRKIARNLTIDHVPTPRKKSTWSPETIRNILKNEKYQGDAILGKTYVEDFLTKKVKKNHGERRQFYLKNSLPAIVSRETFKEVQRELNRRKTK